MWQRVLANPYHPHLIVIDPRKTETAMAATEHVANKPKSDLTLLYGIANLLIERGWINREYIDAHTNEFDAFAQHVQSFTEYLVEKQTGIEPKQLERITRFIHEGKRVSFWWTMGVNQSYQGTHRPSYYQFGIDDWKHGTTLYGANSITGQCNAMGSRLFSNTTNLLEATTF
ncbi:MAG: molybdopterin-dependent oxidoreductase [Pirellulaceae bacterium]